MRCVSLLVVVSVFLAGCSAEEELIFGGEDLRAQDSYRFILQDSSGDLWNLENHSGKTVVIVFMYSRCQETCPIVEGNIAWIFEQLTPAEEEDLHVVAITMDYRQDSPEVLEDYKAEYNYSWPHLTGSKTALESVWEPYGIVPLEYDDESGDNYEIAHQQYTYILDTELKLRVRWSGADWPADLFLEDLRTVMAI